MHAAAAVAAPLRSCCAAALRVLRQNAPLCFFAFARAGSGGFDDGATPGRKYFPYDLVPKSARE
jgi:hypothetical protein